MHNEKYHSHCIFFRQDMKLMKLSDDGNIMTIPMMALSFKEIC